MRFYRGWIKIWEPRTSVSDLDDCEKGSYLQESESVGNSGEHSGNYSIRENTNNQLAKKSKDKIVIKNSSITKPNYGAKRKFHEENNEEKKPIACPLKSMNGSFEERRNNTVPIGTRYHFAVPLHAFISNTRLKLEKSQANAKQHPEAEF